MLPNAEKEEERLLLGLWSGSQPGDQGPLGGLKMILKLTKTTKNQGAVFLVLIHPFKNCLEKA